MRVPWVGLVLFVFAACGTEAKNCSLIQVPRVRLIYWKAYNTEKAFWLRTVPNASYTITGCCSGSENGKSLCSNCPTYKPLTKCRDNPEQENERICQFSPYIVVGQTVSTNLSISVPGCPIKSKLYFSKLTWADIQVKPVYNLTLKIQRGGGSLLATWFHENADHLKLCYFYNAAEILESQKKDQFDSGEIKTRNPASRTVTLPKSRSHAYKSFEFCVKPRYCPEGVEKGIISQEKCVKIRLPAAAPSKPLKMLCGQENQDPCPVVQDETERNVTLFWELPEKSSWNGLATQIKIKIRFQGKDENYTDYRSTNATNTNYTLTGLKLDGHYKIQLIFCSSGGEGPSTTPIELFEIKAKRPDPVVDEGYPTLLIIIVLVAVVLLMIVVVVVFIYQLFRTKRMGPLPNLEPPAPEAAHSGTAANLTSNPANYDSLLNSDEQEIRNESSSEKLSCNGSNSSESTTDSASCPLVANTPGTSRNMGHDDVAFYA